VSAPHGQGETPLGAHRPAGERILWFMNLPPSAIREIVDTAAALGVAQVPLA
jgi:hypothetical protein